MDETMIATLREKITTAGWYKPDEVVEAACGLPDGVAFADELVLYMGVDSGAMNAKAAWKALVLWFEDRFAGPAPF